MLNWDTIDINRKHRYDFIKLTRPQRGLKEPSKKLNEWTI